MPLPPECMQKGHPNYGGGRPRENIPEKDEMIELGKDLVEWASTKVKGELRCRWCEWYAKRHFFIRTQWEKMIEKPEFRGYYEVARVYLSERWLDGTVKEGIAQRYLRLYDKELRDHEDQDADNNELRKVAALKRDIEITERTKLEILEKIQEGKRVPK